MNSDPIRLADDPTLSDSERELLVLGAQYMPFRYDTDAGLVRFRAGIQNLAASQNAPALGNGAGGLKVVGTMRKVLGKVGLAFVVPVAVIATIRIANVSSFREHGKSSRIQGVGSTSSLSHVGVRAVESENALAISSSPSISAAPQNTLHTAVAMTASSHRNATRPRAPAARPSSTSTGLSSRHRFAQNPSTTVLNETSRSVSVGSDTRVPEEISISQALPNQPTEVPSVSIALNESQENRPTEPSPRAPESIRRPSQVSSIALEMQEIAQARKLVAIDPDEALELLETTASKYPRGYFVEERRALTIFALVASGKRTRAKELAATFLRDYPTGLFTDNVRRAVARETTAANKPSKP